MENLTFFEIVVYAILMITYIVIIWEWAKNGYWEVAIQNPPNSKAFVSVFIGVVTLIIAGYAEREGYVSLSLFKEEKMLSVSLILISSWIVFFLLARYVILPKGLPEYNRGRIRTLFWAIKYYRPGEKIESANDLFEFPMARKALKYFMKSIELQEKGSLISVDTAYGAKLIRDFTPFNRYHTALVYGEMAFLLRIMNKFDEARDALEEAEKRIDQALIDLGENEYFLEVKSLILFRKGELAHVLGDKKKAKGLYQESLDIDNRDEDLIMRLIAKVS
jgi:tetratricopeptide (TPR) repeat protein